MDPIVHNRVRELRQAHNLTQEQLAEAAGVSRQSMNAIERGRYIPSLPLALQLARIFTRPVEQIFSLDADGFAADSAADPSPADSPANPASASNPAQTPTLNPTPNPTPANPGSTNPDSAEDPQ